MTGENKNNEIKIGDKEDVHSQSMQIKRSADDAYAIAERDGFADGGHVLLLQKQVSYYWCSPQ